MEESTRTTLVDLLTYKEIPLLIKESKVAKPVERAREQWDMPVSGEVSPLLTIF